MTIQNFFVREVTILHPAFVASYGDGVAEDWVAGTSETVMGWLHQLSESEQVAANRDASVSTHVLRVPTDTNIIVTDQVRIDGQLFDVDGPPAKVWRPAGQHHVRVSLRATDG